MNGAFSISNAAVTPDITALANKHQDEAQTSLGKTFTQWNAVAFSSQIVTGTNYWIKVQTGETSYVHIKVFVPLPHTGEQSSLIEAQSGKALEDAFV
jgi:cystatin-A/B